MQTRVRVDNTATLWQSFDRSPRDLIKRFNKNVIVWASIKNWLRMGSSYFRRRKKLTLRVCFDYVEDCISIFARLKGEKRASPYLCPKVLWLIAKTDSFVDLRSPAVSQKLSSTLDKGIKQHVCSALLYLRKGTWTRDLRRGTVFTFTYTCRIMILERGKVTELKPDLRGDQLYTGSGEG